MEIKVLCNCGSKFKFEIEPVNGRMPTAIACPVCGADATEAANMVIAQNLASTPMRIGATPKPAHAPLETLPPLQAPVDSTAAMATCSKHHGEIAAAECFVCQKPICHLCMEQFGYLCSAYCKGQAQARKLNVPVFAGQKHQKMDVERRSHNFLITAAFVAATLFVVAYLWYWFVASRPKQAFKIETGPGTPFLHAEWIGGDRFFAVTPVRIVMFNAADASEIWGVDLPKNELKGEKSHDDSWYFPFHPRVKVVSKDIWIGLPKRIWRLDGETGKKKQEYALPLVASEYRVADTHFLAVSVNPTNESKTLTRVDLGSGRIDTDTTPAVAGARRVVGVTRAMPGLQNTSLKNYTEKDEEFSEYNFTTFGRDYDYVFTAPNVAHITRQLVEERVAVQPSVKAKKGPLLVDQGGLRASQGMAAAQELVNANQPDVRIDESLYNVSIRRYFGAGSEWSGQVTGRPYFYAQKTVDLLVAGKTLIVFDKNNRKLWEAKLTYMTSPAYADAEGESGPALEIGSRLLFHDQGVLTAFDPKKGDVQWRVNAVGIDGLASDGAGNVYLSATTAGPEDIKYTGQINFNQRIYPQIFKVDLKTGKVLWQKARAGGHTMVSGDYVYTSEGKFSGIDRLSEAMGGDHAQVHWRLFRIDPGSGRDKWEYYRQGEPNSVQPHEKRILLQYPTELRMLKYL